jgi:hypothetical protein
MNEFSTPITDEQRSFLFANKNELLKRNADGTQRVNSKGDPIKDDAGGSAIWQNRIKMASEAYQELKSIEGEYDLTAVAIKGNEDDDGDVVESFTDWATFRDNFILDWIGSRTVVNEKEADMIFERTADEALALIEQTEAASGSEEAAGLAAETANEPAPAPAPRKRKTLRENVRPLRKSVVKSKKTAPKKKKAAAAKKKSGGTASAKAQVIIEKYAAKDWSRKEIIQKLQDQLGMGAAYASTLYQKFA